MRAVGIRELKSRLSHYVRLAEGGEAVLVTDRGTVVAELHPPGRATAARVDPAEARLAELARRSGTVLGAPHDRSLYDDRPRALPKGKAATLLDEERGGR